ncbi:hypothetical protein QFW96_10995 [Saccharopolyspora sp. TS4A08]|uniref:Secreted protein n=1 Tax=Saccharopolyspora ipomoeae TaxID=3042027 RepID=A0ABT6PMA6_9PSEU|nr:hypothetical protein [Saccharopolyspora sp. TS4A08]MDI2029140.1 hypothetical protein [Saccharopolyspora sp. TS4A08]
MDEIWLQVLVALIAGAAGAGVVLAVRRRGVPEEPAEAVVAADPEPLPRSEPDGWEPFVQHCEQAVRRACRAVEAVSSLRARNLLRTVVRRMDAELPSLRVFAELGRGLGSAPRDVEIARRVRAELTDAEQRFAEVTAEVLDLVEDTDPQRVQQLRCRFPLVKPLSAVLPEPVGQPC